MTESGIVVLLFVIITSALPILFVYTTHSVRFGPILKSCDRIVGNFISCVFLVFGLNPAFLANEVWGARDRAQAAAAIEGDVLRNVARLSLQA